MSTPTLERESVQAVFAVMKSLNKLCKNRLDRAVLPCLEAVLNPTCVSELLITAQTFLQSLEFEFDPITLKL